MRVPIPDVQPVAIALDEIDATGDVKFTGIDLESGSRVTVQIHRSPLTAVETPKPNAQSAHGLVLVISMETFKGWQ